MPRSEKPSVTLSEKVATDALTKVVDKMLGAGVTAARDQLKAWKTKKSIRNLYKKIYDIRRVKTIWQVEKEVDLGDFYYPSRVLIRMPEDNARRHLRVNFAYELPEQGNVVVTGSAGQGKSIFFRYLASQEMVRGEVIPVFLELRRLQSGDSLLRRILDEVAALGLPIEMTLLERLLQLGKFMLFLDGFDEVPEREHTEVISQLEQVARRYPSTRILVSSRPKLAIESSAFFRIIQMAPLQPGEFGNVVRRLASDEKTAERVIKELKNSASRIADLLTTPLIIRVRLAELPEQSRSVSAAAS